MSFTFHLNTIDAQYIRTGGCSTVTEWSFLAQAFLGLCIYSWGSRIYM